MHQPCEVSEGTWILSIDPGETTGVVLVEVEYDDYRIELQREIKFSESFDESFGDDLLDIVSLLGSDARPADYILIEDMVLHGRLNQDKVIQIRAFERIVTLAGLYKAHTPILYQAPELKNRAEAWFPDHLKKKSSELSGPHTRDAYRHILVWAELQRNAT